MASTGFIRHRPLYWALGEYFLGQAKRMVEASCESSLVLVLVARGKRFGKGTAQSQEKRKAMRRRIKKKNRCKSVEFDHHQSLAQSIRSARTSHLFWLLAANMGGGEQWTALPS